MLKSSILLTSLIFFSFAAQANEVHNPFARVKPVAPSTEEKAPSLRPAPRPAQALPRSAPTPNPALQLPPSLPPALIAGSAPPPELRMPDDTKTAPDTPKEEAKAFLSREEIQARRSRCPESAIKGANAFRVGAEGGVLSLKTDAPSGCILAISSRELWADVRNSGSSTLAIVVEPNPNQAPRQAEVAVVTPSGSQLLFVTQSALEPK